MLQLKLILLTNLELTSEYNMNDAYTQRTCTAQPALVENILREERPNISA